MRQAIDVGPFGELADPRGLAGLAARAEAAGWDGFFVLDPGALAELAAEVRAERGDGPFDLIVDLPPGQDVRPWAQAGATWVVTDFGLEQSAAVVAEAIEVGPQPTG